MESETIDIKSFDEYRVTTLFAGSVSLEARKHHTYTDAKRDLGLLLLDRMETESTEAIRSRRSSVQLIGIKGDQFVTLFHLELERNGTRIGRHDDEPVPTFDVTYRSKERKLT